MNRYVPASGHGCVGEDDVALTTVVLAVVVGAGAEQVAREPAPRAVGCAVIECLCRGDRPLADDAGQDGSSDDGAARCVLLDDGVDAAGDARAGGNAPVGVEDDRDGKREGGDGAHAWSSEVLGVAEVFSPGAMASR